MVSVIRPGQRIINIPGIGVQTSRRAVQVAAASDWWAVAGKTCVAAYQAKGAASLAASYSNLANPGTYDAAPGVACTLNAAGWGLDGTQWLNVGLLTYGTVIARVTPTLGATRTIVCGDVNSLQFRIESDGHLRLVKASAADIGLSSGTVSSGTNVVIAANYAVGAQQFFINGSSAGTLTSGEIVNTDTLQIGTNGNILAQAELFVGTIAALALWLPAQKLTAGEVATVSAAMAAL